MARKKKIEKTEIIKSEQYKDWIQLFPNSETKLDMVGCDAMADLILETAEKLEKPTHSRIAEALSTDKHKVLRDRIARLILSFGIEEDYAEIKREAREKRKSGRAA